MPTVSPDGRTYSFDLRDDFVFSPPSNERVTAEHFKYAIDRSLHRQMNSPSQAFLGDIVGAQTSSTERRTRLRRRRRGEHPPNQAHSAFGRLPRAARDAVHLPASPLGPHQSKRNRRPGSVGGAVLHRRLDTQPRGPPQGEPELHGQPAAPLRRDPFRHRPPARDDQARHRCGVRRTRATFLHRPMRSSASGSALASRQHLRGNGTSATRPRRSSTWR